MGLLKRKIDQAQRLNEAIDRLGSEADRHTLTKEIEQKKIDLVNTEIAHKKQEEEWDKKEREITHKIGLQKQRGEQELELAKRSAEQERVTSVKAAELAVREANLETERKLLAEQITTLNEDLHKQINYLKDEVLSTVIKAVPNFNVDMVLDPHGSRNAAAERKAIAKGKILDAD